MSTNHFIAVDWGTSNCRASLVRGGECVERIDGLPGAKQIGRDDFVGEVTKIRERLGDHPMLLSGMVGSTIGWQLAPYCPVPASAEDLRKSLLWIDKRTAIVPGISQCDPAQPDVMRGEEVQIFGAAALLGNETPDLYCQPGTHSKWARIERARIVGFETAMTGEVFDLLRTHSVLATALNEKVDVGDFFRRGLDDSGDGNILAKLFRARSGSLLLDWSVVDASAYVSGLLIGSECRSLIRSNKPSTVCLVADEGLGLLYRAAITGLGGKVIEVRTHNAFLTGMTKLATCVFTAETAR